MKERKACGWILITPEKRILLLRNQKRKDWGLPKGHLEPGESEEQTAFRELYEETHLTKNKIQPNLKFRKEFSYYPLKSNGSRYKKVVVYFMAFCLEPWKITLSSEHDLASWSSIPDILYQVEHNNLRHLILESIRKIN